MCKGSRVLTIHSASLPQTLNQGHVTTVHCTVQSPFDPGKIINDNLTHSHCNDSLGGLQLLWNVTHTPMGLKSGHWLAVTSSLMLVTEIDVYLQLYIYLVNVI